VQQNGGARRFSHKSGQAGDVGFGVHFAPKRRVDELGSVTLIHGASCVLRAAFALYLFASSCSFGVACAENQEDVMRFPSTIGSLNLFMRHQGPTGARRGPPVLILHGATFPSGNAAGWKIGGRSWMDELASAGYDVYALDFLGYGESDRYPEMAAETSAGTPLGGVENMVVQVERAVAEILKAHGGQRINLVAHSAGTFVAARFAQLHPDRVARLVLFGAPAPSAERRPASADAEQYLQVSRADQLNAFESKVRESHHLDSTMFEAWTKAYLATDRHSGDRQPASVRVPAGLAAAVHDMKRLGQLPYDPKQVTTPVLVIQGEWDAVAPPSAGLWLFDRLGSPLKRFVVFSQAGHRAHLENNRRQLYRETEVFLNGGDSAMKADTLAVAP
jgi:pimeloyl-ACP methyl ester carboxylesterase